MMGKQLRWFENTSIYNSFSLSASLLRQVTYTGARLGIYQYLEDSYKDKNQKPPNFASKLVIGMIAGGLAALVGTPADLSLIRMASDGRLPPDQRRNYKHCFDALARIVREEGVTTLWRGWKPTVTRAVVLNSVQLGAYSQAKQMISEAKILEVCKSSSTPTATKGPAILSK